MTDILLESATCALNRGCLPLARQYWHPMDWLIDSVYGLPAEIGNNKASLPGKQYSLKVYFKGWPRWFTKPLDHCQAWENQLSIMYLLLEHGWCTFISTFCININIQLEDTLVHLISFLIIKGTSWPWSYNYHKPNPDAHFLY